MTKLLLLENMNALTCEAKVTSVLNDGEQYQVLLDQSCFYPQGGGQPCDRGRMVTASGTFLVESVRWVDGEIVHYGQFESGKFIPGDQVQCEVDADRRSLNTRNHSAGHLIDLALKTMEVTNLEPAKGYHFPEGPYVEYEGVVEDPELASKLEATCNKLIAENRKTRVQMMEGAESTRRMVFYGAYGVPCGGTHVNELSEIGRIEIRKVKSKKGITKVKYLVY
jgi:Ser-tRNA(Ala) deacylase AlaX